MSVNFGLGCTRLGSLLILEPRRLGISFDEKACRRIVSEPKLDHLI